MRAALLGLATTAALALTAGGGAKAASFDCARAASGPEKAICADPALSRADEALASAYKAALAVSPTPAALRRAQLSWLKYERDSDPGRLGAAIAERTVALRAQAAADTAGRVPVPIARIGQVCAPVFTGGGCSVEDSGRVRAPTAAAPGLWWQTLRTRDDFGRRGAVVLQAPPGAASAAAVLWIADEASRYEAPRIVASPAGPLLEIKGYIDGTGNLNAGALFQETAPGRWREIDHQGWLDALRRRLPKGLGAWKGVFVDLKTFTASTSLWRDDDANCCPSGGAAKVTLRLEGDRLVIADVKVTLGAKAARGQ